jgi:RHS repeat-associated protein
MHADALGSITEITGKEGNFLRSYRYDAWGEMTSGETAHDVNPFRYVGAYGVRWQDNTLGMYHMNQRFYNPGNGRFIVRDFRDPLPYAYTLNNPATFIDPSGQAGIVAGPYLAPLVPYIAPTLVVIGGPLAIGIGGTCVGLSAIQHMNSVINQSSQTPHPVGAYAFFHMEQETPPLTLNRICFSGNDKDRWRCKRRMEYEIGQGSNRYYCWFYCFDTATKTWYSVTWHSTGGPCNPILK